MRRASIIGLSTALCLLALGPVLSVNAGEPGWRVEAVPTPGKVGEIVPGDRSAAVRIGRTWYRAAGCSSGICLTTSPGPARRRTPPGGLPDGRVAHATGPGIVQAWYDEPTRRYDHAILGDAVEAGALRAVDSTGKQYRLRLAADQVFEDLVPRIADIDGDDRGDIVAIRSFLDRGASLAVYYLAKGELRLRASSPPIGKAHRWLNIAGIADFDGDGTLDIAIVTTPHIGGTLEFWSWRSGHLTRTAAAAGFSNHAIGSRALGLSAVADVDGDTRPDLALPDASRGTLKIVKLKAGRVESLARVPLPGRIAGNMAAMPMAGRIGFLVGLEDGRLVAISR